METGKAAASGDSVFGHRKPRGKVTRRRRARPASERGRTGIVQLLAEGKSYKEIGDNLGISVRTAETHRATALRKLELDSLADLVCYAIRNRIIEA